MPAARYPVDEGARLKRLRSLAVLDTESEPLFDSLTAAAAALTGRPIALISLVDAERQWFKSNQGLVGFAETPRDASFCAHAILGDGVLEVRDASVDPRFVDNPLVTGSPNIRFYAGAPIELSDGLRMGSLCVIDSQPGVLESHQRDALVALAKAAAEALELRRYAIEEHHALEREATALRYQIKTAKRLEGKLRASESFLDRTGRMAGIGGWELDLASGDMLWSREACRIYDVPAGYRPNLETALDFYTPETRETVRAAMDKAIVDGEEWDLQLPVITATRRKIWVRTVGAIEFGENGLPERIVGAFQDVTLRKRAIEALEASDRRFRKLFEYSLGLICTHGHDGVLLSVNPAAADALGYSVGEMIGRPLTDFIRPELHPKFRDYLLRMITNDRDAGLMELVAKDGSLHTWQYRNVLDDDVEGGNPYILGHAQDVTDRHRHEQKLREWSIRDALTGCFNRRYLTELMAEQDAERWGCIVIDLDHFKQVNDTQGHKRGDEVLKDMASFLTHHVRGEDAVVRLGGDEFLILLRDADEVLTSSIIERIDADRQAAPIAFTLGSTTLDPGVSLEAGMAEADRRLYEVRAERRGSPR
jgi:diguanylate cyclase (GGDEF)-like protein/PAS domain S-box-containing protein